MKNISAEEFERQLDPVKKFADALRGMSAAASVVASAMGKLKSVMGKQRFPADLVRK